MRRCAPFQVRLNGLLACTVRRCSPLQIRLRCSPALHCEKVLAADQAPDQARCAPCLLPCARCGELGLVHSAKGCSVQAIQAWRDGSGYSRAQLVKQYFLCVAGGCPACVL